MSPAVHASARHWLAGLALAVLGVVIARLIASDLAPRPHAALTLVGELTALAGLLLIALGIHRRLRAAAAAAPEAPANARPASRS